MKLDLAVRKRDDETQLVPLINIVFLLLIFFMLSGNFSQTGPFDITPPDSSSPQAADEQSLVIYISAGGRLAVDDGGELALSEVKALIGERMATEPKLRVQLKADGGLVAEKLLDLLEAVKSAGPEKMALLVVTRAP